MFLFAKKNRFQIGKITVASHVNRKLDYSKSDAMFVETSSSIERQFAPKGFSCNVSNNKRKDVRKIQVKLKSISSQL